MTNHLFPDLGYYERAAEFAEKAAAELGFNDLADRLMALAAEIREAQKEAEDDQAAFYKLIAD